MSKSSEHSKKKLWYWAIEQEPGCAAVASLHGPARVLCRWWPSDGEPEPSDARLLAAAPELLEACKAFVAKVEAGKARSSESYAQMKAAIARAERRKP